MPKKRPRAPEVTHTKLSLDIEELEKRKGDDPQEIRALELEEAGLTVQAQRVRECGVNNGVRAIRTCKIRGCPRCAAMASAAARARMTESLGRSKKERMGVLNVLSKTRKDLKKTLDLLHDALVELRRRMRRMEIARVVGSIEPVITLDGARWNAHVHVVVECKRKALRRLQQFWKKATSGRGHFEANGDEFVRNPGALANYMSKSTSWCPPPGTMAPDDLRVLLTALKGRHLHFRWGFGSKPAQPRRGRIIWVRKGKPRAVRKNELARASNDDRSSLPPQQSPQRPAGVSARAEREMPGPTPRKRVVAQVRGIRDVGRTLTGGTRNRTGISRPKCGQTIQEDRKRVGQPT